MTGPTTEEATTTILRVLTYVSIRHNGTQLAGGDEIQGLTLGGVGARTTVNNIELWK